MTPSEYNRLLVFAEDPYQGYLYNEETKSPVPSPADVTERQEAERELFSLGFRLFLVPGGELEDLFLLTALAKCRESLAGKGIIPSLIYCDEDIISGSSDRRTSVHRESPFFKPDFSPDTLDSFFYIGGAFLLRDAGQPFAGEDFVFMLSPEHFLPLADIILDRYLNEGEDFCALHIDSVLYHSITRRDYSYPDNIRPVTYNDGQNKITHNEIIRAIILSKNNETMLLDCIDSLTRGADMPIAITVVDNGSDDKIRKNLEVELKSRNVSYIYKKSDFIYSALCNLGARNAVEPYLMFLNDDIILPENTKNFPSSLIKLAARPHAGAVGAKLLYPAGEDGKQRIQHAGIALLDPGPSHKLCGYDDSISYEMGRNRGVWDVFAVTGACLAVDRIKFEMVGGFDERLRISYTDVDLCMDLYERGLYNIVNNDVALIHYESVTRGRDDSTDDKARRLADERRLFYEKHPGLMEKGDVFYGRNLTRNRLDYTADYVYPWEKKGCDAEAHFTSIRERQLLHSIDRVTYIPALFDGEEACYEVEGWCIAHGVDMSRTLPAISVTTDKGRLCFYARYRYRSELPAVFPGEKNVALSGFICRMRADLFNTPPQKEDISPLVIVAHLLGDRVYTSKNEQKKEQ